jgi:5-methylcytosine-specific restriction endonuclease McrA
MVESGVVESGVATSGVVQAWVAQPGADRSGSPASLFADPTPAPTSPLPATITLRGDGLQVARFEALLEKAHKLGLIPAGADRLDTVLAGLESLVTGQAGATPAHGPATQIVIHQCPDCRAAAAVTHRGELPLAPAQVAAAACDARVRAAGGANKATIPPKTRAAVLARDRHRCSSPGCRSTRFLEVHHVTPRALGGSNKAENLTTMCSRCHRFAHEVAGGVAPAQVVGQVAGQVAGQVLGQVLGQVVGQVVGQVAPPFATKLAAEAPNGPRAG